ncbi:Vps51/Vps67-domain-containing protein [Gymnopilus junonius]|uniref:Vacuolar protein sorting-associated protein 51 homolog n=1 Tax=Gymnopilus junonius TaxID=109634 RepID=A0A9P5NM95_GYMJU|nr:Vps51/Vps67-domain-containing protein [Gymnopilus junonius]
MSSPSTLRVPSIPRPPPSPLRSYSSSSNVATPTPSNPPVSNPSSTPGSNTPRRSTPPPQKTRARDLLRKHYGLGVGPPPPRPGNTQDPMDLNSSAFDAKSYYEQLITTSSLPALLKRENELLMEIRQLDSERQSLVYNHHHELIAASDTISAMKTRAESLDGDLDLLRAAFDEISRLTAEVSIERPSTRKGVDRESSSGLQ